MRFEILLNHVVLNIYQNITIGLPMGFYSELDIALQNAIFYKEKRLKRKLNSQEIKSLQKKCEEDLLGYAARQKEEARREEEKKNRANTIKYIKEE